MNRDLITVLNAYSINQSQRMISSLTGFSLGKVNKLVTILKEEGYIINNQINIEKSGSLKLNSAIILAAGPGLRMLPLNEETPKQLLKINGEILIERLIKQLKEKNINNIYVVVGYKKEQFEYLIDAFDVKLIINKEYLNDNNLYSLFLASKYLSHSYIIPGDLYFYKNPFNQYESDSYYTLSNKEKDYGYYFIDKNKNLMIGKNRFYDAVGLAFISHDDSIILKESLNKLVNERAKTYWESILFSNSNFSIKVKFINNDEYREINTFEDLRYVDKESESLNSENIKTIEKVFNVNKDEIKNVAISKKGMTNRSFTFEVKGHKYIMRIPGQGTDKLINRRQEYEVYQIVSPLGISDKVIYMDPVTGVKITEFFLNSYNCDAFKIEDVRLAMKKLKEFHNLKLSVDFEFDIFQQILYYEKLMGGKSLYKDYEEVKENVFKLKDFVDKEKLPYQLCHIDSVPDNFLIGEKEIKLIDWEYASNQDPHVDIAMFAIYSIYDKEQIDQLIDIYFDNKCLERTRMKIYAYIAMCGLLWSNWCEFKHHLGVEFGEYSLSQYRYGKVYSKYVLEYLKNE